MNNIKTALGLATDKLKNQNITSASLDAEVLLSWVLKKPKVFLYSHPEHKLKQAEFTKYKNYLRRRLRHEPAAYITGSKEFYGLNFFVNQSVLIPRPLTEEIIEKVKILAPKNGCFSLLDIGTGSGCIAVIIAKLFPMSKIIAADVSGDALKVARKNAKHNQTKIKFIKSDLLDNQRLKNLLASVDIITANLPYISPQKYRNLAPDIRRYEPKQALVAKNGSWEYYRKLFKQLKNLKTKKTLKVIFESPEEKIVLKKT